MGFGLNLASFTGLTHIQGVLAMKSPQILVAVDGSNQSFQAVDYVLQFFSPGLAHVTLLHVFSRLPDACWDLEDHPGFRQTVAGMRAWASGHKKEMEKFVEQVQRKASQAGFSQEQLTVIMPERKIGIARDIAAHTQQGFDALVLGRSGLSKVKDILLGSVADKLAGKLGGVPLWLIGGQPDPGRLLVALDNSAESQMVAHYVGKMAVRTNLSILLLNVQRGLSVFLREYGEMALDEEGSQSAHETGHGKMMHEMEEMLLAARSTLVDAGIAQESIQLVQVRDVPSRAASIMEQAKMGEYGTIVVGRRGLSKVREFLMGRVSNKVMRLAKKNAVWVVG